MFRQYLASTTLGLLLISASISSSAVPVPNETDPATEQAHERNPISPGRRIDRSPSRRGTITLDSRLQSIDGSGNHLENLQIGAAHANLRRLVPSRYADGVSEPAVFARISPRAISNHVAAQSDTLPNSQNASDYLWQWGQFLDHDLDLTDGIDPAEPFPIEVPLGGPVVRPKRQWDCHHRTESISIRPQHRRE